MSETKVIHTYAPQLDRIAFTRGMSGKWSCETSFHFDPEKFQTEEDYDRLVDKRLIWMKRKARKMELEEKS